MTVVRVDWDRVYASQRSAQGCNRLGWPVVPWRYDESGRKKPTIRGWTNGSALTTLQDVIDWFSWHVGDLAGVLTGPESGVFVVDIDPRNGGDVSFKQLVAERGELPTTFTVQTPSGGWHLYYAWPELPDGRVIRKAPLDPDRYPGIDIIGHGGFAVAPGVVTDRGTYQPDGPVTFAKPPGWLVELASGPASGLAERDWLEPDEYADEPMTDLDRWVAEAGAQPDGTQDYYLFRALCAMRARNRDPDEMDEYGWRVASEFTQTKPEPWTRADVEKKVRHIVATYPPGSGDTEPPLSEELRSWVRSVTSQQLVTSVEPVEAEGVIVDTDPRENDAYRKLVNERALHHLADRDALRWVKARELAEVRGERPKRTARDFAMIEKPAAVLDGKLAAEVNLLGGPSEAGKSLQARDWILEIAASGRNVVLVLSEGQHDFVQRWTTQPLWDQAADHFYVLEEPVDLTLEDDVDWLLAEYRDEKPVLFCFDVIYGMGMSDDNGFKDALPVINSLKRISATCTAWGWTAGTLAIGHPPHSGERRFRGSSAWRQLAAVEWHMADGRLTCEKSKITDKRRLARSYRAEYPKLEWLDPMEAVADSAARFILIEKDIEQHPDDKQTVRAQRLAPQLGISTDHVRKLIRRVERGCQES